MPVFFGLQNVPKTILIEFLANCTLTSTPNLKVKALNRSYGLDQEGKTFCIGHLPNNSDLGTSPKTKTDIKHKSKELMKALTWPLLIIRVSKGYCKFSEMYKMLQISWYLIFLQTKLSVYYKYAKIIKRKISINASKSQVNQIL